MTKLIPPPARRNLFITPFARQCLDWRLCLMLESIAAGDRQNDTAEKLGIAIQTVKAQTKQLMTFMRVNNSTAVLSAALQYGYIDLVDYDVSV